jgi:hypothetical protein
MVSSPWAIRLAIVVLALALALAHARRNLALRRPVTASSARFGLPAAVVNGLVEWGLFGLHTGHDRPAWITVDLEGDRRIDEVRTYGRGDGDLSEKGPSMIVELSMDGRTFHQAGVCEPFVSQASPCHVWPGGARARYVRLSHPDLLVVSEIEVYGAR